MTVKQSPSERKDDRTTARARMITDDEHRNQADKTARLRKARLAKEMAEAITHTDK